MCVYKRLRQLSNLGYIYYFHVIVLLSNKKLKSWRGTSHSSKYLADFGETGSFFMEEIYSGVLLLGCCEVNCSLLEFGLSNWEHMTAKSAPEFHKAPFFLCISAAGNTKIV